MNQHFPQILKVEVSRSNRRRSAQETFVVHKTLFNGYRIESSASGVPKSQSWRDELDLERFEPPTPEKIEMRLLRRGGRKKGRVLKLYQAETLIAVLSCHIDRKGHIVILHADSAGLRADRELQLRILLKVLRDLNARRDRKLANKEILWRPHDQQQMRLAQDLDFTEVARPGSGRELPYLRKEA